MAHDSSDAAYDACAYVTSLSINNTVNPIDIANKDSGENSEFLGGRRSTECLCGMPV